MKRYKIQQLYIHKGGFKNFLVGKTVIMFVYVTVCICMCISVCMLIYVLVCTKVLMYTTASHNNLHCIKKHPKPQAFSD